MPHFNSGQAIPQILWKGHRSAGLSSGLSPCRPASNVSTTIVRDATLGTLLTDFRASSNKE